MSRHLIHIGYPKTGSNFLRRWFAGHPQLAYVEGGVAGFQSVYAMVRSSATGASDPQYRVTSAEGFATPHASFGLARIDLHSIPPHSPEIAREAACDLLQSMFPGAHVLIVTRGIRNAVFSGYSQYLREGGHLSFSDFCREDRGAAWNYDAVIARYRTAFGAENVIVLPYELLRDDPRRFLNCIATRLGLEDGPLPTGRDNPSLSGSELAWYPRIARWVRRLPLRGRAWRVATVLHTRLTRAALFGPAIALLQYVRPLRSVTIDDIADATLAGWTHATDSLRDDPLYQPYADDYFRARAH